jgi:transposase
MLARFEELTDDQWKLLVPSIPVPAHTGRPRADDRSTINGILYVLLSGCRWMDMPPKYGSYKTVWGRHKKWSIKGVWKINIMNSLISCGYTSGLINNMDDLSVDSSTVASKKEGKK